MSKKLFAFYTDDLPNTNLSNLVIRNDQSEKNNKIWEKWHICFRDSISRVFCLWIIISISLQIIAFLGFSETVIRETKYMSKDWFIQQISVQWGISAGLPSSCPLHPQPRVLLKYKGLFARLGPCGKRSSLQGLLNPQRKMRVVALFSI